MAVFAALGASAQLNESFTDGDFTNNPAWTGNTDAWTIVANSDVAAGATGSNTLRLNAGPGTSGVRYLSTQVLGTWGTQQTWGFWMGRREAATDPNRSYVWLYANEANVNSSTVDGYRIRLGQNGSFDHIMLELVTDGAATTILESTTGIPNGLTDFGVLVRVTRSSTGLWSLFTSTLPVANGSGAIATDLPNATNANVAQGTVTDNTITNFDNGYIAFAALHTTGANPRVAAEFDQLSFSFVTGATLPVKFGRFTALEVNAGIKLSWNNETESEVENYFVERSTDGQHYTTIAILEPKGNNGGNFEYSFVDATPAKGNNFYRIRVKEITGKLAYSDIVRISFGRAGTSMTLYPNPLKGGKLSIQLNDLPTGRYTLRVLNLNGQTVAEQSLNHPGGAANESITLRQLKAGIYVLELNGTVKMQQQFVVQ